MNQPPSTDISEGHFFAGLFQGPFPAAFFSGSDFVIEKANDEFFKLIRKDKAIIGKQLLHVLPEMEAQPAFENLRKAFHSAAAGEKREEILVVRTDGVDAKMYVNLHYKPLLDEHKKVIGMFTTIHDITDHVVARQRLQESEERMRLAAEVSGLGTFDKDYKTGKSYSSQRFASIFGFSEPVSNDEYVSRVHPDDMPIRNAAHAKALKTGKLFYEPRIVLEDGTIRQIRVNGTVLFDETGSPTRLIKTVLDITDERAFVQRLAESEERFRTLISETPEVGAGLFLGRELKIQYVNDVMLKFWGKDQSIVGKRLREALPELVGQPFLDQLDKVFTTGIPFTGKGVKALLEVDGELRTGYYNYTYKPLRNPQGEIYAIHHMAVDVSDEIKTRNRLIESEQHVKRLFQQTPVGIAVFKGETLIIEMANDAMLSYWGRKYEEVINKPLWDALPEVKQQGFDKVTDGVYKTGIPYTADETPVSLLRNGKMETIFVDFTFEPRRDEEGATIGLMVIANDVTDMVIARKELEKNQTLLIQLADQMPQLVWMAEADGSVTYYNKRVSEFAGFRLTSDGRYIWEGVVHPGDAKATANAWSTAVNNLTPYEIEHRIQMKDGAYRWHLSRAYPYHTDEGIKWYGTATDIHDSKLMEMNLEGLVKDRTLELQRSNDDLQQFAHVASHDLKEPVRKIKTFSYKLQDEFGSVLGERGNTFIHKILSSSDRMNSMINGVLDYASMNSVAGAPDLVDLNSVIRNIQIDLELLIQEKQASIFFEDLPTVRGIPELMHQLFYNLINNSLKFARENMPSRIKISSRVVQVNAVAFEEIVVSDNGIGFDTQHAEQIFSTFLRLNSKDKYEGSGLGLSLCKKIVERHGGSISAEGTSGLGATFKILLPK